MRIGIVTLTGYYNYGNRLQNFALQEVLNKFNVEVKTIEIKDTNTMKFNIRVKRKIIYMILKLIPYRFFKRYESNEFFKKYKELKLKDIENYREKRIYNWSIKNIDNSSLAIIDNNIPTDLDYSFDFFVAGSDQVWNPYYYNYNASYFLYFAQRQKRVSYAASFGISEIPKQHQESYRKYLNEMHSLSVREHAGQKIIKDLTGRDSEVLIDPTMMLTKEQWLKVTSKPKCIPNKKYLLTYVLGNQTEEFKSFINKLARERDLEVLNLLNPYDKDIHCVDPGEFVYLINNADVMITDSFHGAVFSILMETPFVIFERQDSNVSMNSRIDTLVTTFKMESRLSSHIKSVEDVYNIDFSHVDEILKYEREKSINYLKNSFSIE